MGLRVEGLGFRVWGLGTLEFTKYLPQRGLATFRGVWGVGFRASGIFEPCSLQRLDVGVVFSHLGFGAACFCCLWLTHTSLPDSQSPLASIPQPNLPSIPQPNLVARQPLKTRRRAHTTPSSQATQRTSPALGSQVITPQVSLSSPSEHHEPPRGLL